MIEIFKQKPLIVMFVFIFIGAVVGVALSLIVFSDDGGDALSVGDRFVLATGESPGAPDIWDQPQIIDVWQEEQPLTLNAATSLRWKKDVQCVPGIGHYSRRAAANDNPEPYSLIFDSLDRVVGVYMYSENEQQAPWKYREDTGPYPYPHWGLHIFFFDSSNACN
tara:strand:+ start:597 stop:1091 length:495 start_codon:yes stop_codon:yes gene_type:complete